MCQLRSSQKGRAGLNRAPGIDYKVDVGEFSSQKKLVQICVVVRRSICGAVMESSKSIASRFRCCYQMREACNALDNKKGRLAALDPSLMSRHNRSQTINQLDP